MVADKVVAPELGTELGTKKHISFFPLLCELLKCRSFRSIRMWFTNLNYGCLKEKLLYLYTENQSVT